MADKHELPNYNPVIAEASNNIGQKLFAYISNGKNINDRIRDKFKKSLIFIGDEGQIYNPLTNTYVGIGQTAYTHTISYIEDAQEKIKALQKMLASSMVSAIYANWYKDEWDDAVKADNDLGTGIDYYNPFPRGEQPKLPTKIYATNEIILKGKGDYDPVTKLAATREYAHITDKNNGDDAEGQKLKDLMDHTFKVVSPESAFATSGITVSLKKGLNRYLYSYTFINKLLGDGIGGKQEATDSSFSRVQNIYLTDDEYNTALSYANNDPSKLGDVVDKDNLDDNGEPTTICSSYYAALFYKGLVPQYDDNYTPSYGKDKTTGKELDGNELIEALAKDKRHQLFKQSANTLTIDDEQTWSYIASAYSYTIGFAKEYTDDQVNRIYRDLLGEVDTRLIPVSEAQVKVRVINPNATFDQDALTWDETNKRWINVKDSTYGFNNGIGFKESVKDETLSKYILDYNSVFVAREDVPADANLMTDVISSVNIASDNYSVYPWKALKGLATVIYNARENAKKEFIYNSLDPYNGNVVTNSDEELKKALDKATDAAVAGYTFTDEGGNTHTIATSFAELKNVYFMDYERDSASEHKGENFDRNLSFNESRGDNQLDYTDGENGGAPKTDPTGSYGSMYDDEGNGTKDENSTNPGYGYSGTKYSLPFIYQIVTEDSINDTLWDDRKKNGKLALFAVNTSWTAMDNFNLADGINTLKEVAYVLDYITDGWGNQYDDAEGNGILLTYTIANNHERIEDHEKRLRELEGGTNVVKAIYKDERTMSQYVNLHFTSDTSWFGVVNNITSTNWDTLAEQTWGNKDKSPYGLDPNVEQWAIYDVITNDNTHTYVSYAVPSSYIASYNAIMKEYITHKTHTGDDKTIPEVLTVPNFTQLYSYVPNANFTSMEVVGFLTPVFNDNTKGQAPQYFKDSTNKRHDDIFLQEIPTYVGQVGIGVDINVATTYSSRLYCDNDKTGFISVDLNSNYIKKTAILHVVLPGIIDIRTASDGAAIDGFATPDDVTVNSNDVPYVNTNYRYNETQCAAIHGSDNLDNLQKIDKKAAESLLETIYGLTSYTIDAKLSPNPDLIGAEFSLEFIIDPKDAVNDTVTYRKTLYEENEKSTVLGVTTVTSYKEVETDLDDTDKKLHVYVTNINKPYYIRYIETPFEVKQVVTNENALTNVDWVQTYVGHVVTEVGRQLKDVEFEAYLYSKNLINQLDNFHEAREGQYVAGIKQENGIVTPIVKDLPKDTISSSVKVWGENTDIVKKYVSANDALEEEIGMDTPIFVKNGEYDYIELPDYDKWIELGRNTVIKYENGVITIGGLEVYWNIGSGMVNASNEKTVRGSFIAGEDYKNFIQCYTRSEQYVQIDAADIVRNAANTFSYMLNGVEITEFWMLGEADQPAAEKKYISTESYYQSDDSDGSGANILKVTAHITKLSDATEENSGLADAHDIKQTLDNMFEWVDLSRWELYDDKVEGATPKRSKTNPINNENLEAGGDVTAAERINDTKKQGNAQNGYPMEVLDDTAREALNTTA